MINSSAILLIFVSATVFSNITATCNQKDVCSSYLDIAIDIISKAKTETCNYCAGSSIPKAVDCADIFHMGKTKSGVYEIWPMDRMTQNKPLNVYCDMETDGGGWTVIQRRGDFHRPKDYFFQDWKNYKDGFGDIEKDFWLGNDNIFALTNPKLYSARFDLKDVQQDERFALYNTFWTDDENHKYTLHVTEYSGNAGDSLISVHNNQKFSTKDQDNDNHKDVSCAVNHKSGWWFNKCHLSNLNGIYYKGKHESYADGVNWYTFRGYNEALEWTEIKIRPKNFCHITKTCNQSMQRIQQ